ncbi:hypothetical protein GPL15_18545 [Clostridium sp. MCC353]|uniref:hypothetical protein n=1 Tax=Clostridium sp. MCC353 TaxID=2592646 RepID=UPI001C0336A4|nr:hypothetical protein [Clostridium sp. MCC353]MBT9778502.1 hypothetical protein [Clostridium sp. MCC353]
MKKIKIPVLVIGIAAAAAVIGVAAFGITRISGGKGEVPSVSYIKDNELYRYNVKSGKELKLASRAVSENEKWYIQYSVVNGVEESEDGRYAYFFEEYDGHRGKLCYINQKEKDDSREKIDSEVEFFKPAGDSKVVYLQDGTGALYMYDVKRDEKEKMGVGVTAFDVSEDGKKLLYITEDSDIYYKKIEENADKEKLDSDVEKLFYYTKDLNTIYYTKDTDIYCIKNLKDREKVASDAVPIGSYNDNAGIYYTRSAEPAIASEAVLIDDLAASDAEMPQPLPGKYTKLEQTSTGKTIMVTDEEAFSAAKEEYRAKQGRDEIRKQLKAEIEQYLENCTDLYSYDGVEHELLKNAVTPLMLGSYSRLSYTFKWEEVELPRINIADIESYEDITEYVSQKFETIGKDGIEAYLLADGKTLPFTYESSVEYRPDEEAGIIYGARFSEDPGSDKKDYSELFSVTYTDSGVGEAVSIDNELGQDILLPHSEGGRLYYYKDYGKSRNGVLYCNGEKIDEDVYYHYYDEDSKLLYYLKEMSKSGNGTLCRYDGSKTVKLIDDAIFFNIVDERYVAALVNYSAESRGGDLKLIPLKEGGKVKKIDEDVSLIQDGLGYYGALPY